MKNILKKCKEKKGMATIEFAIGVMILFSILVFFIDLFKISYIYYISNQQLNYVSRTLGIEGGIQSIAPQGFPETYYTSGQLLNAMDKTFNGIGINSSDVSIIINDENNKKSVKLTPTTNLKVDYTKGVNVELHVKYKWGLLGQMIPAIKQDGEVVVKRYVVSEFKYDYNDWR